MWCTCAALAGVLLWLNFVPAATPAKLHRKHDKFIFASTALGNLSSPHGWLGKDGQIDLSPSVRRRLEKCIPLNVPVPESYDPLPLCLKKQDLRKMAIHEDFRITVDRKGQPRQESTLADLMKGDRNLAGFVIGMGVSYVRGYNRDSNFYGTIAYRHLVRSQMIMCSVVPISLLGEFVDLSNMDDDETEEFVAQRTVKNARGLPANAIVTCGDMHREDDDDVKNPFMFKGQGNPTNVKSQRTKRAPTFAYESLNQTENITAKPVVEMDDKTPAERERLNEITYKNFFNPNKNGTYFATVCYLVDVRYIDRRFNGSKDDLSLLLTSYVDLTDWILRATDWNQDGVPDNIGIRMLRVQYFDEFLREPEEKWGREEGGKFTLRNLGIKYFGTAGTHLQKECDIRTGIGEINVPKYVIAKTGGCVACESDHLSSFVNPYMDKFSPRGEYMRMLYKQIRLLSFALVYTKGVCANCTEARNFRSKADNIAVLGSFDGGDVNWGSCIVEGDLQARSNLPLNSFRMSVCSQKEGARCLKHLSSIVKCMEFKPEESYCGNGIVEGDEECDCGTLATCAEQQCTCSPRSGLDPCRFLDGPDTQICFQLIKCRGFRFLYELGLPNNSHFLAGLPDVIDRAKQQGVDSGKGTGTQYELNILMFLGIGLMAFLLCA